MDFDFCMVVLQNKILVYFSQVGYEKICFCQMSAKYRSIQPRVLILTYTTSGLIQQMTNWWYFFIFTLVNRIWHFMQIVSIGDNLHEMLNLFPGKNKKNISMCCQLNILPRVLSVKTSSSWSWHGSWLLHWKLYKIIQIVYLFYIKYTHFKSKTLLKDSLEKAHPYECLPFFSSRESGYRISRKVTHSDLSFLLNLHMP